MAKPMLFNRFYKNCVHDGSRYDRLIPSVHIIVKFKPDDNDETLFEVENEKGHRHAEIVMLQRLTQKITDKKPREKIVVTIHSNFSPCENCSRQLIHFKESQKKEGLKVEMKIIFVALYRIERPSCMNEDACRQHCEIDAQEDAKNHFMPGNKRGLVDLKKAGIELETFKPNYWRFVCEHYHVDFTRDSFFTLREKEDKRMETDLQTILSEEVPDGSTIAGSFQGLRVQDNQQTTSGAGGDQTSPSTETGKKRAREETSHELQN